MEETAIVTPIEESAATNTDAANNSATQTAEESQKFQEQYIDNMMNFAATGEFPENNDGGGGDGNGTSKSVGAVDEVKAAVTNEASIANPYESFGFKTAEELKAEIESLRSQAATQFKPEPYKYATEESERIANLINKGDYAGLKKFAETKVLLSGLETMGTEDKLKLYIKMQNPRYDQELINDEYNSLYKVNEDDFVENPMALRREKLKAEQKIDNDLEKADEFFKSHSQKVQLPDISAPQEQTDNLKAYQEQMASIAKANEYFEKVISPSINALKEEDLKMSFELNEPKNQMQFRVSITPSKEHLASAKQKALEWDNYLQQTVYDKDGNFLASKAALLILRNDHFDEYAQSTARQAVNAERISKISESRGGGGGQREVASNGEMSELDKRMNYAFAK